MPMKAIRWVPLVAFLWGWAEATWFFIIPDFWLTFTVFWGWRCALTSVLASLLGALVGATSYYLMGDGLRDQLGHFWQISPGYSAAMFEAIARHLLEGATGLVYGPWQGLPYRFYLHQAYLQQLDLPSLWGWTVLARLPRLVLAPLMVGTVTAVLDRQMRVLELNFPWRSRLVILLLGIWVLIYYDYWFVFVPKEYP